MTSSVGLGYYSLLAYPVVFCQWVGLLGFHRSGRKIEWWSMLAGAVLTTIGTAMQIPFHTIGFGISEAVYRLIEIITVLTALGSLLFTAGVAIHANRSSRVSARMSKLEMMNLAQATELERLRNR